MKYRMSLVGAIDVAILSKRCITLNMVYNGDDIGEVLTPRNKLQINLYHFAKKVVKKERSVLYI